MNSKLKLLIAGRSKEAINTIDQMFAGRANIKTKLRHIVNGHADPLHGLPEGPDLLVLCIAGEGGGELEALLSRPVTDRPPFIIVAHKEDPAIMRLAMKAGARDFLSGGDPSEIVESVETVGHELSSQPGEAGRLVAVINAKGGSGATFVACNLAHLSMAASGDSTALIALDTQFPTLPAYLDLKMRHGLLQAMEAVESLDSVALDALMESHSSGLRVLAARPDEFRFSLDRHANQAVQLFDLLCAHYQNVVVDVPRHLDEISSQVLSRASKIVLTVQQSLPHVQDATRLQQLMRDQLGIAADKVLIVVNRYTKSAEIELSDIENAFGDCDVETVPNNFRDVSESINLGVPIYDHSKQAAVTKALIALQSKLFGLAPANHPGVARARLSSLLQKTPLNQLFGGQ